MSSTALTVSNF